MATPRIFVSHSHQDNDFAVQLVADLRRVPGNDENSAWLDASGGLVGGVEWWSRIEQEITSRPVFILILSPDAVTSKWVNDELNIAWHQKNSADGKLIIPVLLRSCEVRPSLRTVQWVRFDFPEPYETAFAKLLIALRSPDSIPTESSSAWPPFQPSLASAILPRLAELGFGAASVNDVEFILPPASEVPEGTFLIGSDSGKDANARPDEQPQHKLWLPTYSIARYPVTVAEYACYIRQGGREPADWATQRQHVDHPVTHVTWNDAETYAHWLAGVSGNAWRLPTEAEWEKAARWDAPKGHARLYPWGDAFEQARCNSYGSRIGTTTPVGTYPSGASPFDALDMAGNVWEWTSSSGQDYPYPYASGGHESRRQGGYRVLRGGSWSDYPEVVRAACRARGRQQNRFPERGFRLVLAS